MDSYLRKLKRQRGASPGDNDVHAKLIVAGMRIGELTYTNVSLVALWGHKAARLALGPDIVKGEAIIYQSKRYSFAELRDIIKSSKVWPADATRRIAIGIAKVCIKTLSKKDKEIEEQNIGNTNAIDRRLLIRPSTSNLVKLVKYTDAFLNGSTDGEAWKVLRRMTPVEVPYPLYSNRDKREISLRRIALNCCGDILTHGACHNIPLAAVAWFNDCEIYSAVRDEIYPWALRDFS